MPRFFFDYRDKRGVLAPDEDGLDLPDFETAYLEAYRAAIDMWAEARREGHDPGAACFEIKDQHGNAVLELPIAEVLNRPLTVEPRRVLPAVEPPRSHASRSSADQNIALVERHIADQRGRIVRLLSSNCDAGLLEQAERLLNTLLDTEAIFRRALERQMWF